MLYVINILLIYTTGNLRGGGRTYQQCAIPNTSKKAVCYHHYALVLAMPYRSIAKIYNNFTFLALQTIKALTARRRNTRYLKLTKPKFTNRKIERVRACVLYHLFPGTPGGYACRRGGSCVLFKTTLLEADAAQRRS